VLGIMVGDEDGLSDVGVKVGETDGILEGAPLGKSVGGLDGKRVAVGLNVGDTVGDEDGMLVGSTVVGDAVGDTVGDTVGEVEFTEIETFVLGEFVGAEVT